MAKLRDIMSTQLVTVNSDASVQDVARLMQQNDVGDVLVMRGGQLAGIVTDRDLVVRGLAENADVKSGISNLMSGDLVTLEADTDVQEAARVMADRQVRRVPVVENGQPVGIVSLGDLAVRDGSGADEQALEGISE